MNNELFLSEEIAMSKEGFFYSYKKQTQQEPYHLFLESGRGGMQSIAAWNPLAIVSSNEKGIHIKWRDGREEVRFGESLTLIEELTQAYALHNVPTHLFTGGVVGAISYDYNRKIEKIASVSEEDLRLPDHYFYLIDCWAVFNELKQTVQVMKTSTSEVDLEHYLVQFQEKSIEERQFHENTQIMNHQVKEMKVSMESKQFEEAVDRIQKYIEQGDVFQVNLSVRQSKVFKAKPIDLYEALRTFNPSPYMAMIQSPDFAIVSGSPELLVKKQGLELSTRPIAGTRPRGKDHSEDLALAKELIDNPKERAEHVMLVDLERNDLGKVSKYGTVFVDEFMVIEKYSHVMHIVSNVRGELATKQSATDVIRAMFPGGTITGAPKIRTMEIIEELEPVRRGIYTGSIGWIGYNGDLEMNIVIRTAFIQDETVYIQAGAGIVIDSIPEKEYIESLNKAKAMWQAVQMVEEVLL